MSRGALVVLILAGLLAMLGAVPSADHTTHRVLEMVRPIPWSEVLLPFWNPPPMEAWAIRPGSVVLIKMLLALTGLNGIPPTALIAAGAFVSIAVFGLASMTWLRRVGMGSVALPATLSTMLLSPTLFSAWLLTELDTLGAGLVLAGSALLIRRGLLGWRVWPAALCVLLGLMLKESTGLIQFAFLISGGLVFELHHRHRQARRHWLLLGMGILLWATMVAFTLNGKQSLVGNSGWIERLPILEHNQAQLVYLATIPGALLIALGALARRLQPSPMRQALPWAGLLLLILIPPVVHYSHYEAVYFSPRWVGVGIGCLLWIGLLFTLLEQRSDALHRLTPLVTLLSMAIFSVAILTASNAREDMASRLFLALAPGLHGLAWMALRDLKGTHRVAITLLGACLAWTPLASCWNSTMQWRHLQAVDLPARKVLVSQDLGDSLVIFNHVSTWLGTEELEALDWIQNAERPTHLVKTPGWLRMPRFPDMDWGTGKTYRLEDEYELKNTPIWLYWLAVRSEMDVVANRELIGALEWTRRPLGVFTPINHAPGDNEGARARREQLPAHNLIEDMRMITYGDETPTLLSLSIQRGESVHHEVERYALLPTLLADLGQRLTRGIPWLEHYRVEAILYSIDKEPSDSGPR